MGAAYTGAFELRRLVVKFNRTPSGGVTEDYAAFTFHYAKLTSGAPDAAWLTADYAAVEGHWDTCWTSWKPYHDPTLKLAEYRWYKDGPVWSPADLADGPANPAERITARSVVGTGAATPLPPQVALTLTKIVDVHKRWGRAYLPAPIATYCDADGRVAITGTQLAFFVTCLNASRAAGKQPVVFTRGRSAYVAPSGHSIAAHPATAYEITALQMDNLWDVVRSRRWDAPTVRSLTTLT